MLRGMLESGMAEARRGRTVLRDVAHPAAKVMLHFLYTDELPEGKQYLYEDGQQSRLFLQAASCMLSTGQPTFLASKQLVAHALWM
jgi:hypothetical protein